MLEITAGAGRDTRANLGAAIHRNRPLSREGLLERLFTVAFRGLVYPQRWEDPVIDMEALRIGPGDHVVAISSGGCNVMSYLVASPAKITALDLNGAHVALTRLKICAARHLPRRERFHDFFVRARLRENVVAYDRHVAPRLDAFSRAYWETRDALGRRRIAIFARGLYRHGLLGRFIGGAHAIARLHGVDLRDMLRARTPAEQRALFETRIAPVLEGRLARTLAKSPAALYGLGIPPSQYRARAADSANGIPGALRDRVERLCCDFPVRDNYFAWQAFGRGYDESPEASLPPWLEERNYESIRARAARVDARQGSITEFLSLSPERGADCFVLLDAQDWMNDRELTALWRAIERAARPGARVIFRTAANERLLPGRVPDSILDGWDYDEAACRDSTRRDRSAIYGGFHLYRRKDAA